MPAIRSQGLLEASGSHHRVVRGCAGTALRCVYGAPCTVYGSALGTVLWVGQAHLGLDGGSAEVWGADDVGVLHEGVVLGRLLAEDIECCLCDLAALDGGEEVLLLDDSAAGDVDDADALLALREDLQHERGCAGG